MANNPMPSQQELRNLLSYDPETGKLFWQPRPEEMFTCGAKARAWNTRYAGREAFTASNSEGYKVGRLHNGSYRAHRVIWKLVYGTDPETIDHVNGIKSDNRLPNLRECTHRQNCCNYKVAGGASSYRGVRKQDGRWTAQISLGSGKRKHLGMFGSEKEAARAYDAAARLIQGEFATLNFPSSRAALHSEKEG